MRTFTTLFAVAVLVLAVLLCPGCKKRQTIPPVGPGGEIIEPLEGFDGIVLSDAPPIFDFQEPENTEVFQDIHFDFDRSEVRAVDRPILEGIAEYLQANSDVYLLIEGHCDERGTNEYNLALGEKRSLSTREFLAGLGVAAQRIVTITLGEEDPIDLGHTQEAWAKNRRAHFKVAVKGAEGAE
ncbi:OmpA family protein [bacterium]|nr:OmpA family protein [bacterium]